jgi:glycosyltransferase involved in cell wall biosynthesis
MLLTVFTPSYNRAQYLPRLFESLKAQEDKDFEFVLVDDGSSDGTPEVARRFEAEAAMSFKFLRKENGGLHTALNAGLRLAEGELFLFTGSDSWLEPSAVRRVREEWEPIRSEGRFAGVAFRKMDAAKGEPIGKAVPGGRVDCSHVEAHFVRGFGGDKAEFIRTELLRALPYPEIPGEKYFPVGHPYNVLSARYILRYVDETIYNGQYLPGGLSSNFAERLRACPRGFLQYYEYLARFPGVSLARRAAWAARAAQCRWNILFRQAR